MEQKHDKKTSAAASFKPSEELLSIQRVYEPRPEAKNDADDSLQLINDFYNRRRN